MQVGCFHRGMIKSIRQISVYICDTTLCVYCCGIIYVEVSIKHISIHMLQKYNRNAMANKSHHCANAYIV